MKTYPLSFTATIGETLQKYIRVWNKTLRKLRAVEQAVIFLHQQECDPGFANDRQRLVSLEGGRPDLVVAILRHLSNLPVATKVGRNIFLEIDSAVLKVSGEGRFKPDYIFVAAVGETCEVAHFLTNDSEDIIVDILHFSPPCQTFSSAKTIAAATDSANEACIFSSRELLLKIKPRVATMEETSGLQERHKEFLYATIHTFVDLGYSIRWKFSEAIQ
ncbi:hypothetical protein DIZ76_016692 [Coccidioides immitis]|nr:hypothetical protein DIZ76_016692 [Coccidioides immitis]